MVGYCSRECQKNAWKKHKVQCKEVATRRAANTDPFIPDPSRQANIGQKKFNKHDANVKIAKMTAKGKVPSYYFSNTAQGMVGSDLPIPEGVPKNFKLKQQAKVLLSTGPSSSKASLGNLQFESTYRDFYDDFVADNETWMSFLDHPQNFEHAE